MLTATWFKYSLILKHTGTSDEKSPLIFADAQLLTWPTGSTPLWGKFNKFRYVLTKRPVSINGRLQLFNAVITPTVLFGLGSLPLTKKLLEEIDAVQTKC